MIYNWKNGSRVRADANAVGKELERIARQNDGRLTPKAVLDDSRAEDAPLHGLFQWEDSLAAEAYREDQARYITRSITVIIEDDNQKQHEVRAFTSLVLDVPGAEPMEVKVSEGAGTAAEDEEAEPETEQVYVSTLMALARPAWREQLLAKARYDIDVVERRYQDLEELAPVFAAWGKVRQELQIA